MQFPFVFVVDADALIASTVAKILQLNGYPAKFFTSSFEAIAAARFEPPYLLISDVMMPGLSGIDLAIQITIDCPGCEVLLFSGQPFTCDLLEEARGHGNDFHFMQKPVHPSELLAHVGAMSALSPSWVRFLDERTNGMEKGQ